MNNLTQNIFRCIVEHRSASGQLLRRSSFFPNSIIKNWIFLLSLQFSETQLTLVDTSGYNRNTPYQYANMSLKAAAGIDSFGIVVGGSNQAVSINDTKLINQYLHGTDTNKLLYSTNDFPLLNTISSTLCKTSIQRTFTNSSPASITIEEIGIYISTQLSYKFCIERTLYNSVLAVDEALSVTYVLEKEIL